jgi:hypothetical protein
MNNIDNYLQELNEEIEQQRDGHSLPAMATQCARLSVNQLLPIFNYHHPH